MEYRKFRKKKMIKRIISFVSVLALIPSCISIHDMADNIDFSRFIISADAEATYDTNKFTEMSTVMDLKLFAEYSRCYSYDAEFREGHYNDTIYLNPTGYWKLESSGDDEYIPLGTSDKPFSGTIIVNAIKEDQSFLLLMDSPLFNVVTDSVNILSNANSRPVPLEFIRISDSENPLMANEIRGDGTDASATWNVILSDQAISETINGQNIIYKNNYKYGGVIGKMSDNAALTLEYTDNSTSDLVKVKRNTAQGTLCGEMASGSSLTATYINSGGIKSVGESNGSITGGLVGSMNGAVLNIDSISGINFSTSNTGNNGNGLIAGSVKNTSVINLPENITLNGNATGSNNCVGGLVGTLEQSDIVITGESEKTIRLDSVTITGKDKTGGVIGYYAPSDAANNTLNNITYNLNNCTISGNNPGGIVGEYISVGVENFDLSKYKFTNTQFTGGSAGGVFGIYNENENTTITGTFSAPKSSVEYGGVIGKYSSSKLSYSLLLQGLTVSDVNQTSDNKRLGGVILDVPNASYIKVDGVTVNVTGGADKCSTSNPFGGIVSTIGSDKTNGSFLDIAGDFTLTTNAAYNGGAVAGKFWNGVLRLAGTTDISGAQTANGYGQLIYDNDNTLVYAKGSGNDDNWRFIRNASSAASDLGQWGEVVRLFDGNNAETAGIVTVDNDAHTVTVASTDASITDTASFAKAALNMQLNDGNDHGALCFDENNKTNLLSKDSIINVANKIDLTGTGLLGLMRDGGNGKYLKHDNNNFEGSPDFFSGTITGSNGAEIVLSVGESYGEYPAGVDASSATGGHIYLSKNYGHDAQGLISFGKGATIEDLTIRGSMSVEKTSDTTYNHLYMAAAMGVMTNGATLKNVNITTEITSNKDANSKYYIGGVSGVFDGNDTSGEFALSITGGKINPNIKLTGDVASYHDFNNKNIYAGGVLGLLKGADATKYKVTISGTEISPTIKLGDDVGDVNDSFIGGMIGYVRKNATNEREISLNTVTMNGAAVEQKCQYSGGLLGAFWDRTQVTIDGLTITGSKVDNKRDIKENYLSGLVYRATGKWYINALSIENTEFKATENAHINFGLIVNEAYIKDSDGLYLNLKNSGYSLTGVTIPTSTNNSYYADEIAAKTAVSADSILSGGNGVGIININMNEGNETNTKITETGTYQNKVLTGKLIANQNARYYYNLDVIKAKGTPTDGEKFLMWSIYNNYASSNIKNYGVLSNYSTSTLLNIDLTGLSYYPVNAGSVTLGTTTIKMGFSEIKLLESDSNNNADKWARNPDATGDMNKTIDTERRNQHYLMHNGLFRDVTGTIKANGRITLAGVFGGLDSAGMLVGNELTGNIELTNGVTLNGVKLSVPESPMLVNYINGTAADKSPQFLLSGLRLEGYSAENTESVASALINKAEGTNMKLIFSDIKLDARNGETISDLKWTDAAAQAMNEAYGTSRSIFSKATLFNSLKSNSTDTIEYYYTWDEDWGKDDGAISPRRNVTYGKEVNFDPYTGFYKDEDDVTKSGERRYSGTKRTFTNPVDGSDTEFIFSTGFLPYVATRSTDTTYNISEVKVNFISSGLTEGCGTYNDPYIIRTASLLTKVAEFINAENAMLDTIRLPNKLYASWHEEETGDSLYHKNDSTKNETESRYYSDEESRISKWTYSAAREYLAGAYYVISNDMTLASSFPGIGIGGTSEKGKTVFHGVIVGNDDGSGNYPTITNLSSNPFICISNGSVVKNLNFKVDNETPPNASKPTELQSPITINQNNNQDSALYGYMGTEASGARYYGGVFGEIMGGDNIIDNVSVRFTENRPILLRDSQRHLIALGGFAGAIVNGGLMFRGTNSVTGLKVYSRNNGSEIKINENEKVLEIDSKFGAEVYKQLYVNPYVGRVINGYAVNEGNSTLDNSDKHYTIDKITPPTEANKLDVNFDNSTINVPNAQALFVMSLITQSTAGTAVSPGGEYGVSQSYGINSDVFCGSNHLGDYSQVGQKNDANGIYTDTADLSDYSDNAIKDVAIAPDDTRKTAVPYIIYAYTKADSEGNYPARTITYGKLIMTKDSDNMDTTNKYWDITLDKDSNFDTFGQYTSFRGIGSVGLRSTVTKEKAANHKVNNFYNMKINSFNGNGNTIDLAIKLTRYQRNQENYFHKVNLSTNTNYNGSINSGGDGYGTDSKSEQLLGLGLFDMTWTKDSNSYYKNFTLKGYVEDVCYDSSGVENTGSIDQTQLFTVGGVVGQGYYGFHQNFDSIQFDGLNIYGAYCAGGLIGMNSDITKKDMYIKNCNTAEGGISVTGGYKEGKKYRHGIGAFVGMTLGSFIHIDGNPENTETNGIIDQTEVKIFNISTNYKGTDNCCVVGGLIGYTGRGAEISDIKLTAANKNSLIGSDTNKGTNAIVAAGFVGFAQQSKNSGDNIVITNCTIENLNIRAVKAAGGFFGKSWDGDAEWCPRAMQIKDCSVVGNISPKPEIKATGVNSTSDTTTENSMFSGGLVAAMALGNDDDFSFIQNSYVIGYQIQGWNVGGLSGSAFGQSTKSVQITNCYVEECDIINNISGTTVRPGGGILGLSQDKNIYGYNIMTKNVVFKKSDGDYNTSNSGAFIGNSNSKEIKLIAVAKYADEKFSDQVPTANIKNGTNPNDFIVFADYTAQNMTESKNTENISSFGNENNINDQNKAPYLTIKPSSQMGNSEYISGDGAYQFSEFLAGYQDYTSGKSAAARIYADYAAGTKPNRAYTVTMDKVISSIDNPVTDMGDFFKQAADSNSFKISTWNTEMGVKSGVDDFTLLVVNDANNPESTTFLIDNYIRLMTNTNTHYMGDNDGKYKVVVTPCGYDLDLGKFVLKSEEPCGLNKVSGTNIPNNTDGKQYTNGYYQMVLANADSKYNDRFTLIDVQYLDPTDTNKIAYHLYVPVLTKKTVNIEFYAASISGSEYMAKNYTDRITSEIAAGKNANNPTTLVDSMDVWTTTYIRFQYPADQVNELLKLGSNLEWNHKKQISIRRTRENDIPDDTKMVLIDPNNNKDKAYYATAASFTYADDTRIVDFSSFTTKLNSGEHFHEQTLHSLLYDKVKVKDNADKKGAYKEVPQETESSLAFKIDGQIRYFEFVGSIGDIDLVVNEPLNEEYYLSLYVPKTTGQADVVQIQPAGMLSAVSPDGSEATGNVIRATVSSKLNAALIIGDFYKHTVTDFKVNSNQNSNIISEANNTLTATTTSTIELVNDTQGQASYFAITLSDPSIALYHSFNLQLICHTSLDSQTDIIKGIDKNNIKASYKINNAEDSIEVSDEKIVRETSYIQCTTGDIKSYLINPANGYQVTITGTAEMTFSNYSDEFPSNPNDTPGIGVQGAVRSNIAYQEDNLPYSKMFAKHDPVDPFYYTKEENSAQFSFDVIDELDEEEIGTNTKNNSRLGVNDFFTYNNTIHGKSVYNAIDVKDYDKSTSIEYTLELFRKTTTGGVTEYKQVNIPDYISDVQLIDSDIQSEGNNLKMREEEVSTTGGETVKRYVYSRELRLDDIDKDAIFFTDFSCNILKDSDFAKKEYGNYKLQLTVRLNGSSNNEKTSYIIYTNAKIDPSMIEEVS